MMLSPVPDRVHTEDLERIVVFAGNDAVDLLRINLGRVWHSGCAGDERDIRHRAQTGKRVDNRGDGIGDDSARGDVTVCAARNRDRVVRIPGEANRVVGIGLSNGSPEDEGNDFPVADEPSTGLIHTGGVSGFDDPVIAFYGDVGDDGLDDIFGAIEGPPELGGDEVCRFGQSDVTDLARRGALLEFFSSQTGPDFLAEGQSSRGSILNPLDLHAVDATTHRRDGRRKEVHQEARIDTGSEYTDAVGFGRLVDRS